MTPSRRSELVAASSARPTCIVIFGATGDLTRRKLAPALHSLACAGLLPESLEIVGVGRRPMDDETFRSHLYEGIQTYARLKASPHLCTRWDDLRSKYHYARIQDVSASELRDLFESLPGTDPEMRGRANLLLYLAMPPELVPNIVSSLGSVLKHEAQRTANRGWVRLVLEKPFGRDEASARALDALLAESFSEHSVYRIDHYLGKETVQNLLAFRFANGIFEPLWSRKHIQHVQITVAESIGIEGRAESYDRAGVVRDVVQNHLLQLLSLVAMEPPSTLDSEPLRDEKVRVLETVSTVTPADFVLGQYDGYISEDGAPDGSTTPTYAALRLALDNPRWRGVPFYLRSGKRMHKKTTEVTLQFKPVSHRFLSAQQPQPNRLSLHIQPNEGMRLQFAVKVPGAGLRTSSEDMSFEYSDRYPDTDLPDAYERLLLDALRGDPSLFIRRDEIEVAWRIVAPLLHATDRTAPYPQGSWGPAEAERLLSDAHACWMSACRPTGDE